VRLAAFKRPRPRWSSRALHRQRGVLSALLEEGDVVVSDKLNHASIIDGIRLTKADRILYEHCDLDDAERPDAGAGQGIPAHPPGDDGVFSMDGDIAPFPAGGARRASWAAVMVDDAHATGVLGDHGGGAPTTSASMAGWRSTSAPSPRRRVWADTSRSQTVRDHLIQKARPFLFSSSHPPAVALSCVAAIDVLESEPELMERLWENTTLQGGLAGLGFDIGASQTPITPVMCGDAAIATQLSDCSGAGVFARRSASRPSARQGQDPHHRDRHPHHGELDRPRSLCGCRASSRLVGGERQREVGAASAGRRSH